MMSFVLGCRLQASSWTLLHEVEGFLEPEILAWDGCNSAEYEARSPRFREHEARWSNEGRRIAQKPSAALHSKQWRLVFLPGQHHSQLVACCAHSLQRVISSGWSVLWSSRCSLGISPHLVCNQSYGRAYSLQVAIEIACCYLPISLANSGRASRGSTSWTVPPDSAICCRRTWSTSVDLAMQAVEKSVQSASNMKTSIEDCGPDKASSATLVIEVRHRLNKWSLE